jgi:nitroreductase
MKAILDRHSIRGFNPIELNGLEEITREAQTAPSAGNLKAYSFNLVTDKDKIKDLADKSSQSWIESASLVVMVKDEPEKSMIKYGERGRIYAVQDATLFLSYFDLLCVEKGWGTCWVGGFDVSKIDALTLLLVGGK